MVYNNEIGQPLARSTVKKQIFLLILFLLALLFFAYRSDWEYDEAMSYNDVWNNSLWDLLTYNKFKLANNHLINSMYFRLLQNWHVTNVVYYRLLGILGFVIFFIANVKLLKLLKLNDYWLIFLIVAPYFFHFALGRGYSMALGCFAMAFFYLLKYVRDQKIRDAWLLVIFGALSSISIFSFLYGYLSLFVVLCLFRRKQLINIHTIALSVATVVVVLYVYKLGRIVNFYDHYIIGVKSFNIFSYGTLSSMFSIFSDRDELIHIFSDDDKFVSFIKSYKILVTLCVFIPLFYGFRSRIKKIDLSNTQTILILLILLPFLFMIAAHVVSHALYPIKRAVFYLHYLILVLILVSTTNYAKNALYYLPIAILFLTSFLYSSYIYYDLSRPAIKESITKSTKYPLYLLLKSNPNVMLVDNLSGINKKNIIMDSVLDEVIPKIENDTSRIRYLLCWPEYKDSALAFLKHAKFTRYREGNALIEVDR